MTAEQAYAILKKKIETGGIPEEQIQAAIDSFMQAHPEFVGATPEQAEQIEQNKLDISEIMNYINYNDPNILGLLVDYENSEFTRLAGAANLTAGEDFDKFKMYGGRKRCNVRDNGKITAYFGDENFAEDGSNGQVMVYQPKFYYKVIPLKLDPQTDGEGYHIRKAAYYVSDTKKAGFKLHPLFKDRNGEEIDYVLLSAYEGSIYDESAGAYLLEDEQIMDINADKFSSIANAKPASGKTQQLTRENVEKLAQNRGENWHCDLITAESANQLLMIIEMGKMNMQEAIEQGVVSITDEPNTDNNSIKTGGTSTLGNKTGNVDGETGKVSVTYRGIENPWANVWKFVNGVNIHGDGSQKGGIPYICKDLNFVESKNTDNYESAGFTVTNVNGYISAMGYGNEDLDWIFFASETLGNSSIPVGDYTYVTANLNGYRVALLGGSWKNGADAGGFYWALNNGVGNRNRNIGGRLVYVPTKTPIINIISTPENHNGIYRGKDITNDYTIDELADKVKNGDFSGLYLGDYFTIKNLKTMLPDLEGETDEPTIEVTEDVDLMIAGFNYYHNASNTAFTDNHIVLIPRGAGFATTAKMNGTNTTDGGYLNSYMHKTVLPCYAASLKTALKNHLLSHRELLTNKVTTTATSAAWAGLVGSASGWEWATVELCLMNEVQVYGTAVFGSSGFDVGNACRQLPVFRFINHIQFVRNDFWLRSVASSLNFAYCNYGGYANFHGASIAHYVRPIILFGTPTVTVADTLMEQPQLDEMETETDDINA